MVNTNECGWESTAKTQAFWAAMNAILAPPCPIVISYCRNSETIWDFSSERMRSVLDDSSSRGLVLVWDEEDSAQRDLGGIDCSSFLNPVAWAVCALSRSPAIPLVIAGPGLSAKPSSPLLDLCGCIKVSEQPFAFLSDSSASLAGVVTALSARMQRPASAAGLEILRQHLLHMLTDRGEEANRHALASVIGPLLLMGNRKAIESTAAHPLVNLFAELGLISDCQTSVSQPFSDGGDEPSEVPVDEDHIFNGRATRLLLVDDQWEAGWGEWVAEMVKTESHCTVECSLSPEFLVKAAETCTEETSGSGRTFLSLLFPDATKLGLQAAPAALEAVGLSGSRKLSSFDDLSSEMFPTTPQNTPSQTVLLLDLRLFSLRPVKEEAAFVRDRVLPLCRSLTFPPNSQSPSGSPVVFTEEELVAAERWCENPVRESGDHVDVLTLLPRALALLDFSQPIILFSSTTQRRVSERLKPYANIITSFCKPVFPGADTSGVVQSTEQAFLSSLRAAAEVLDKRSRCQTILDDVCVSPEGGGAGDPAQTKYVELFLDESDWQGDADRFSVGGCFSVHEGADFLDASAKADRFDDWLVQKGVRYFENRGVGPKPESGRILNKQRADLRSFLADLSSSPDAPSQIGLVRLRLLRNEEQIRPGPLFNPGQADNRYQMTLKLLLELFLSESIPAIAGEESPENIVLSIHPATRVIHVPPDYQDNTMYKFGLRRVHPEIDLFFSFDRGQVYPLVAEILESRNIDRKTYRLVAAQLPYRKARGTSSPEYFICTGCRKVLHIRPNERNLRDKLHCQCDISSWRPDYRALHYVADELLSDFPDSSNGRYSEMFGKGTVPGEFDDLVDDHLLATLESGRRLNRGDLARAVSAFEPPPSVGTKPRASHWLQQRLCDSMPSMTPVTFQKIATRIVE